MRALVLEDSSTARMLLKKILQEIGFTEVFEAIHGIEGLERLKEHGKVDLVLVDLNMPVMDGFEFIRTVRRNYEYDDMPLLTVTTETGMEKVKETLEAGANEYVMKPFTKEVIQEKLTLLGISLP